MHNRAQDGKEGSLYSLKHLVLCKTQRQLPLFRDLFSTHPPKHMLEQGSADRDRGGRTTAGGKAERGSGEKKWEGKKCLGSYEVNHTVEKYMWGKKPGEVEMGRGKKILWKSFPGTLPLDGWVQQSAGDRATEGAVPQGKNTGGKAGHCIRQNLKAQSPTQLRIEAPDTSSLSVSMSSDNTETEMAALLCVWRGRGRPSGSGLVLLPP